MFHNRARVKLLCCVLPSVFFLSFFPDSRAESSISLCNVLLFLSTTHLCNTFLPNFLSKSVDWDIFVCLFFCVCRNGSHVTLFPYLTSHIRNSIFASIKWCIPSTDEIWQKVTQVMLNYTHTYSYMSKCIWKSHTTKDAQEPYKNTHK